MCGPQLYGRRPPAGRPRAGRLSAHNERRQLQANTLVRLLPRRGKHCSRPGFVPLNRGPTLTTPQCPAPTAQLGSSSASTASHSPSAPTAPSLQWRYRAQSSPPCPAFKIVALAGQRELPERKAAVGLQLRLGEKMPAVGDVAAAVTVQRQDGVVFALGKGCGSMLSISSTQASE